MLVTRHIARDTFGLGHMLNEEERMLKAQQRHLFKGCQIKNIQYIGYITYIE